MRRKTKAPFGGLAVCSIELLDVCLYVAPGAHIGARGLHFQGDQRRGGPKGRRDVLGQPLVDVAGEGGVPPARPPPQAAGLNGAGVDLLAVVGQHLGVMGDEDLLGASRRGPWRPPPGQ